MTESINNPHIAFVGGGNMARSIIGGLLSSGWPVSRITASDPSVDQRAVLQTTFSIETFSDNTNAINQADIVVFSVKPQILKQAIGSVRPILAERDPLIISIAAGIRTDTIMKWIGRDVAFIRVMPNIPALINCGISALLANPCVTHSQKRVAEQIMEAVGKIIWVESESDIDTVTGISGSGPAYFFKLMEIMIHEAQSCGLTEEAAKTLVLQTALGAAKLAIYSDHSPAELRRQVTSPGGTTEAAIQTMEKNNIDETISRGVHAAIEKSDQLAKTLEDF